MHKALGTIALLTPLLIASVAEAHIHLVYPPSRNPSPLNEQKTAPCGLRGAARGATVATFEPGATITVRWDETINHPSHYRIAFDADGQDDLAPPTYDDATQTWSSSSTVIVLADDIADAAGGSYRAEVTLPDLECESCVLQLIQVMYDKPPYDGANDIYYHCSDIELRRGAASADGGATSLDAALSDSDGAARPSADSAGGCSIRATSPAALPALWLGFLALAYRRAKRQRSQDSGL